MVLARNLRQEIATSRRNVVHPVYGGDRLYPQDETLIHEGGRGFLAYDIYTEIAKDCHAYAVLQKRFMAVVGREWEVLPGQRRGSSSTRQEKKAADMLKAQLEGLSVRSEVVEDRETTLTTAGNFDEVCWNLLWAIHYGWQPAELIWDQDGSEAFVSEAIAKDLRRFVMVVGQRGFKLRMLDITGNLIEGVPLPHRKFIVHRFASVPTEDPYGLGLGTRLFYPTFFKRQDIKFWLQFADKFASPTAVAKYPRGASDADKKEYLAMLDAIATDAGIAIPADVIVEFLESERASALNTYKDLAAFCDGEISKAVLGETGTTDQQGSGGSRARDQVGDGVRIEVAKADADLLSATLNRTLSSWVSWANFGPDVAPPMIWRKFPELAEKEDLNTRATRDNTIASASGRTITEKYWTETYGVEFEPKQPAQDPNAPPDLSGAFGPPPGAAPDAPPPPDVATPDATAPPTDAAALDAPPALNLEEQLCKPCTVEHSDAAAESSTAWTVGDVPAGDIADFARLKMAGNTKQKKNCTKGWSCGYTCLGQDKKTCKSPLQGQVAKYADWLQQQAGGAALPSKPAAAPQNSLATIPTSSTPPARSLYDDPDLPQIDNPSDKDVEKYLAKKKAEFKKISDDDIKALTLRSALTAAGTDDPEEAYAYYGRKIAETWTDGIQEKQDQISALDLKIAKTKSPNQSAKFQKQKLALEKGVADDNQWIAENLSTPSQISDRGKSYVEADEVSIKRLITQSDKIKALYAYAVIKSGAESASDVTNRIAHIEEPKQAAFESIKLAMSGESGNDAKILGLPKSGLTPAAVKAAYKKAAQAAHPDSGGSAEAFYKVNTAYQNLKKQLSFSDFDDPEIVTLNEYAQSIGIWSLEEKPSEPAETPAVETTTQQLTQSAIAQSQQPVEDWFEKVRGLLEGAASLEEVRDRLYELYKDLPGADFAEAVAQAMQVAELAGRWEVLNPEPVANLSEESADFARLKMARNTKQRKNCTKGWSCGYTCLGRDKKNCKSPLQGQVAKYADWLQQQAGGSALPSQAAPVEVAPERPKSAAEKLAAALSAGDFDTVFASAVEVQAKGYELATVFASKNAIADVDSIFDEGTRGGNGTNSDWIMKAIAQDLGYDALPKKLDADGVTAAVNAGGLEIFRAPTSNPATMVDRVAEFTDGVELPKGRGIYGHGLYFGAVKPGLNRQDGINAALGYGPGMIRASYTGKTVKQSEIIKEMNTDLAKIDSWHEKKRADVLAKNPNIMNEVNAKSREVDTWKEGKPHSYTAYLFGGKAYEPVIEAPDGTVHRFPELYYEKEPFPFGKPTYSMNGKSFPTLKAAKAAAYAEAKSRLKEQEASKVLDRVAPELAAADRNRENLRRILFGDSSDDAARYSDFESFVGSPSARYAALRGYDGIDIDTGYDGSESYFVLLNRGAVQVQDGVFTGK